jgi:hypothetical protein
MRLAVCASLIGTLLLVVPAAGGADLYVDAFKHSDPAYEMNVQVFLTGVAGVTGVQALAPDATAIPLPLVGTEHYAARRGPFGTFGGFHAATVGNWRLTVSFAGGDAVYDFTVNEYRSPFTADSFPPAPTMIDPTDGATGVDPTPTFQWDNGGTHDGPMESLFVSVQSQVNPMIGEMANPPLTAETWTPSVVLPAGLASFLVQYETNEHEDANVTDPVFNTGDSTVADPGITWDWSGGDLFSRDLIEFTVIPEPATAALLAVGALALVRRRRRR